MDLGLRKLLVLSQMYGLYIALETSLSLLLNSKAT